MLSTTFSDSTRMFLHFRLVLIMVFVGHFFVVQELWPHRNGKVFPTMADAKKHYFARVARSR
jgi:hypothetical protein